MTLEDSPKQPCLDYWKNESLKAREEVKALKRAAHEATPTSDNVKIVLKLFAKNTKIKKDHWEVGELKYYV